MDPSLVEEARSLARRGVRGTYWRALRRDRRPAPRDFARPSVAGRFNREGEPALYFARTIDAARAECSGEGEPFVLRFDLDLPDARRVEPPPSGTPLGALWARADERASAEEDYALSHRVADVLRAAGIEAVLYDSDESAEDGAVNLALLGDAALRAGRFAVGEPEPLSAAARRG